MAGNALTVASALKCPHGGTVQITPSSPHAKAGDAPLATVDDSFVVVGCPYHLPTTPPTPSPCVAVRWLVADQQVKVHDAATLSLSSQGVCYSALEAPQGAVEIESTQAKVSSQ